MSLYSSLDRVRPYLRRRYEILNKVLMETTPELWAMFRRTYLLADAPLTLIKHQMVPTSPDNRELSATLQRVDGSTLTIGGDGNGPIDAFVDAL